MISCSLSYTIVITSPAYGAQSSYCAYQFCQSLLESHHRLNAIFFYADGTYNANGFISPANDEFDLVTAWQTLGENHDIPLFVCISAAQRRGILNDERSNNMALGFQCVGLGDLSQSIAQSDRVIQF